MRRRRAATILFGLFLGAGLPRAAEGRGLSGRFGAMIAVEGRDLTARIELDDAGCADRRRAPCLIASVREVVFEMRPSGTETWHTARARPVDGAAYWEATFTSTVVPERRGGEATTIELRARVIGARGGTLLEIGRDAPLVLEVLTAPEAREVERALGIRSAASDEGEGAGRRGITGHVGADGRAGSNARARALIGVGGRPNPGLELAVYVAVGPSFSGPAMLDGSGPLVLGFDGAARMYTRDPDLVRLALFVEPFLTADLRFPGFDPGAGLRVGGSVFFAADLAIEASLGGAMMVFRAIDSSHRDAVIGATGGLRVALRFGGSAGR